MTDPTPIYEELVDFDHLALYDEKIKQVIDDKADSDTTYTISKSGDTVTLTGSDGSTSTFTDADTTYGAATASENGLMSSSDFSKLAGIEEQANRTVVDSALSDSSQNPVQNQAVKTALDGKAPLASPALTGTPTAPTAASGDSSTQVATTAFVASAVASAIAGVTGISFAIVQSLPATGEAGVIYLMSNGGASPNVYDEYIYVNNAFEKIGTTEVDLSGYLQSSDVSIVSNAQINSLFSGD